MGFFNCVGRYIVLGTLIFSPFVGAEPYQINFGTNPWGNKVAHGTNIYIGKNLQGVTEITNIPHKGFSLYASFPVIKQSYAIHHYNMQVARHLRNIIMSYSARYGVNPYLVMGVIRQESGFNPGAVQLMPATAQRFGVSNPYNPIQNLKGGIKYLSYLLHEFNGNKELALAAYNAGSQAVIANGYRIPPYPQTEQYVPDVMSNYRYYKTAYDHP